MSDVGLDGKQSVVVVSATDNRRYRLVMDGALDDVTIGKLKRYLSRSTGVAPPSAQVLRFKGCVLLDNATGADIGLYNGSVLTLEPPPTPPLTEAPSQRHPSHLVARGEDKTQRSDSAATTLSGIAGSAYAPSPRMPASAPAVNGATRSGTVSNSGTSAHLNLANYIRGPPPQPKLSPQHSAAQHQDNLLPTVSSTSSQRVHHRLHPEQPPMTALESPRRAPSPPVVDVPFADRVSSSIFEHVSSAGGASANRRRTPLKERPAEPKLLPAPTPRGWEDERSSGSALVQTPRGSTGSHYGGGGGATQATINGHHNAVAVQQQQQQHPLSMPAHQGPSALMEYPPRRQEDVFMEQELRDREVRLHAERAALAKREEEFAAQRWTDEDRLQVEHTRLRDERQRLVEEWKAIDDDRVALQRERREVQRLKEELEMSEASQDTRVAKAKAEAAATQQDLRDRNEALQDEVSRLKAALDEAKEDVDGALRAAESNHKTSVSELRAALEDTRKECERWRKEARGRQERLIEANDLVEDERKGAARVAEELTREIRESERLRAEAAKLERLNKDLEKSLKEAHALAQQHKKAAATAGTLHEKRQEDGEGPASRARLSSEEMLATSLRNFSSELRVPPLRLDANNTCVVSMEGGAYSLLLTFDHGTERLFLYTTLLNQLPRSDTARVRLYEELLEGSLLGREMAGGGVGVSQKNGLVILSISFDLRHCDAFALASAARPFVEAVRRWVTTAEEIAGLPPSIPAVRTQEGEGEDTTAAPPALRGVAPSRGGASQTTRPQQRPQEKREIPAASPSSHVIPNESRRDYVEEEDAANNRRNPFGAELRTPQPKTRGNGNESGTRGSGDDSRSALHVDPNHSEQKGTQRSAGGMHTAGRYGRDDQQNAVYHHSPNDSNHRSQNEEAEEDSEVYVAPPKQLRSAPVPTPRSSAPQQQQQPQQRPEQEQHAEERYHNRHPPVPEAADEALNSVSPYQPRGEQRQQQQQPQKRQSNIDRHDRQEDGYHNSKSDLPTQQQQTSRTMGAQYFRSASRTSSPEAF